MYFSQGKAFSNYNDKPIQILWNGVENRCPMSDFRRETIDNRSVMLEKSIQNGADIKKDCQSSLYHLKIM